MTTNFLLINNIFLAKDKEITYFGYRELEKVNKIVVAEFERFGEYEDIFGQRLENRLCETCGKQRNNHYGFGIKLYGNEFFVMFEDNSIFIALPVKKEV